MKFNQLYRLVIEANDFSDLPKEKPYGFWIAPDGQYFVVNIAYCHYEFAERIVHNSKFLSEAYAQYIKDNNIKNNEEDIMTFLYKKKYVKTVIEGAHMHFDNPYFDARQYPKIMKTIKDIGAFYNLTIY